MTLVGPALVTGALGQDGFILCRRLQSLGIDVTAVVRPGGGHGERRRALESGRGCRLVDLDLGDTKSLGALALAVKPAHIFHLGAAHHSADADVETTAAWAAMIAVNFAATEALARAAVATGQVVSLVYASSSQIWTARAPEQRVDESTPTDPATFYGHTKIWATDLLRQYRHRYGLKSSVAILFNHESPWRGENFVTRRISCAAAAEKPAPLALMNIGARTDWQAAEDVIEALILMAAAEQPDDYVLASGRSHSVGEFAAAAYRHAGFDWRTHVRADRDQPGPCLVGVADKAKRQLGWRAKWTFEALAQAMVDADRARLAGEMQT